MDEQRDKLPGPQVDLSSADGNDDPGAGLPEDSDEIVEIIDEDAPPIQPARTPIEAAMPQEALQQIQNLRSQLDRKDKQIEQVMEAYRAKKAETEKLRTRIEKTERRKFEQSKGDFIARFVEVLDNLDRAIESVENNFDSDSILQGIILVRTGIVKLLREEGLEKIFVAGQPFDPLQSEAAEMAPVDDESQDNIVLRELQRGYMLKGSLLRAARVVVGRFAAEAAAGSESTTAVRPAVQPPAEPPASSAIEINEADPSSDSLEFSEDGLDFTNE